MTTAQDAAPMPGARWLARGITATWWYTASAIVFFETLVVAMWTFWEFAIGTADAVVLAVGVGGVIWVLSTFLLLGDYRHRLDAEPGIAWARIAAPLVVATGYGALAWALTQHWLLALMPLAQSVAMLNWQRGIRLRVVLLLTAVLIGVAFIDAPAHEVPSPEGYVQAAVFTIALPMMAVLSLWWWDVLVTLDRARAAEGRLAATQERLRVATDVHDLQGHHLQVIALQLELAERLMERDPQAALRELRVARASVDDARQGTRDLATQFRIVPLGDELENARDLLRAAGWEATASVAPDASAAPAAVLGPVIRETTTNVLRHGTGGRARLRLQRDDGAWRYEISNEADAAAPASGDGSGLAGITRRVAEAGGTVAVTHEGGDFTVVVHVPAEGAA